MERLIYVKECVMDIMYRESLEQRERDSLAQQAQLSAESSGRKFTAFDDALRTNFQRDRDKILHTKAFRRLSHKTQVFIAAKGDHYRTRLTHTLEVSQIARTISRALGLNEDLTEAIALGHDLGHTPFGHAGERALSRAISHHRGIPTPSEDDIVYKHNEQSLRVVDVIENNGKGLNLTSEVRDGILHHTGRMRAATLEGRVVATADRIAYVNHDIDDALRAGILCADDFPRHIIETLGETHSNRIENLIFDMVKTSAARGDIFLSDDMWQALTELRSFLFKSVYTAPIIYTEIKKAENVIHDLFDYFMTHPEKIPHEYHDISAGDIVVATTDYIAGKTDRYALYTYNEIFLPKAWHE